MQFLLLPLDVVSFYSFLKLIPFTRVCLSQKQCGLGSSSPFRPVDLSRHFLYYLLLIPARPAHWAFFFLPFPFLLEPIQGLFSSHLERAISPWLALPYCSWAILFYSLLFYGYSFYLGLRDMVLLFLPLFLSFFLSFSWLNLGFFAIGPLLSKMGISIVYTPL